MINVKGSDLRARCKSQKQKVPCYVCRKHSDIVQHHHVYPLKNLSVHITARQLSEFIEPPTIALCPTCHAYIHKLMDNPEFLYSESIDLTELEKNRILDIIDMQNDFLGLLNEWLDKQG